MSSTGNYTDMNKDVSSIENNIDRQKIRMLEERDMSGILQLMEYIKPNIGGSRDKCLYKAICQDAIFDERIVFTVAEEDSRIVGFFFGVIDRNRWRLSFIMHHPIIGARVVISRMYKRMLNLEKIYENSHLEPYNSEIDKFITPGSTSRSWQKDSSPQIAKLLYAGVYGSQRGKFIAKRLGEYILKVLAERGVRRVDAVIIYNNIRGIRLDHSIGFKIYRTGNSFFATQDISCPV